VMRGEDWEMNFRLREAGHVVWLDPRLKVRYWPRDNWRNLAKQFYSTGVWRAEIIRRHKGRNPLRFFAPPLLAVNLAVAVLVALLQGVGLVWGPLSVVLSAVYAGPAAYVLVLVFAAATTSGSLLDRLRFVVVLATMHLCWGAGFLRGALRGGKGSLDRSRH
jgi:succinoglycan biosynthesis protein ExoA